MVVNCLNFCLSGKLLISPSNLKESLAGQGILGYRFFPFITLNMSSHSLLCCSVSVEKLADSLIGVALCINCHFSLLLLIFSLSLIFVRLITMCLGVFLLGFILLGTVCASWTWLIISFPTLGKFSANIYSNIFQVFFSLFSFWDPYNANIHVFNTSLVAQKAKNLPAVREIWVQFLAQEDLPGEGNGSPLQYSCLENSMDRGTWQAIVHGFAKSPT